MNDSTGQHATRIPPKSAKKTKKSGLKSFISIIKLPFIILVITLTVLFLWKGVTSITCSEIEVNNLRYVNKSEVLDQIPVAIGNNLYDINIVLIEKAILTLPWVDQVELNRSVTGILSVDIIERTPLVVVLDLSGRPANYLDRDGVSLPLHTAAGFNLPILSGVIADQITPLSPITRSLPLLLKALAKSRRTSLDALNFDESGILPNEASGNRATNSSDWLISEIMMQPDGNVLLQTSPVLFASNNRQVSIPVALGHDNFDQKLKRLTAFWAQAVNPSQSIQLKFIDLRFDNQIITR